MRPTQKIRCLRNLGKSWGIEGFEGQETIIRAKDAERLIAAGLAVAIGPVIAPPKPEPEETDVQKSPKPEPEETDVQQPRQPASQTRKRSKAKK